MRLDRARLGQHLATLDLFAVDATQQTADVVTGPPGVQRLLEHLDAGHHDRAALGHADDLDRLTRLDLPTLDPTGHDRATALDAEDVFDRHQEGLIDRPLRRRDVVIHRLHQLPDRGILRRTDRRSGSASAARAEPRMIGTSSPGKP